MANAARALYPVIVLSVFIVAGTLVGMELAGGSSAGGLFWRPRRQWPSDVTGGARPPAAPDSARASSSVGGAVAALPEDAVPSPAMGEAVVSGSGGCWDCPPPATHAENVLFAIGSTTMLWPQRRPLVHTWWRPNTRGYVWLEKELQGGGLGGDGPPTKVSGNISSFQPVPIADSLRLSRMVIESYRLGLPDVHWFVTGDDDTIFNIPNLLDVLNRYDHRELLYIGHQSESHHVNSFGFQNMAFGGGGIAISAALARELSLTMDGCVDKYAELCCSDMRVHACVAELGVQLTHEMGFHQVDLLGGLSGFLEAQPLVPLVSLHHLLHTGPLLPGLPPIPAMRKFFHGMDVDPRGFLQQGICVDHDRQVTILIASGYSVKILRGVRRIRDAERMALTFVTFHNTGGPLALELDTRPAEPWPKDQCGLPIGLFIDFIVPDASGAIQSRYSRPIAANQTACPNAIARISSVHVTKRSASPTLTKRPGQTVGPNLRRLCCQSLDYDDHLGFMKIELGTCRSGQSVGDRPSTTVGRGLKSLL